MKVLILFMLLLVESLFTYSQIQGNQIEIMPYVQFDRYPEFSYVINGRASTDYIKLKGTSWGIQVAYKMKIKQDFFLRIGIGYYKFKFDDIERMNTMFGSSEARHIGFPSPSYIIFYTNKYWYNTIKFQVGAEKVIKLNKSLYVTGSINLADYFTFSQYYRIIQDYPTGPPDHKYMEYTDRNFSLSATGQVGIVKSFNRFSAGPVVFFPLFTAWAQDKIFPEESNTKHRSKWFDAIGIGFQASYTLTKK